jgi:putative Mg2+ transporter-C (MgtC) family protein
MDDVALTDAFMALWAEAWRAPALPPATIVLRLVVAAALAGFIGFEREARGRSAGLRTHMLIGVASCVFTLVTQELFLMASDDSGAGADPIRIVEAVTAGVAFIAAGAIIRTGGGDSDGVRGLTTGAGLWSAGAIGVATGAGFVALAAIAAALSFVIIALLRLIEKRLF